jgi:hypothetical protein
LEFLNNYRSEWKGLSGANALAYLPGASETKKKGFIRMTPEVNVTKLFSSLLTLSVAFLSSLPKWSIYQVGPLSFSLIIGQCGKACQEQML